MATIQDYLDQIASAVYGKEVRSAIYNAILQCYTDGSAVSESVSDVIETKVESVIKELIDDGTMASLEVNVDETLSVSGAAADAAATGESIDRFESLLSLSERSRKHGYLNSSATWVYTASTSKYEVCFIPVEAGSVIKIKTSVSNTRLYFLQSLDGLDDGTAADNSSYFDDQPYPFIPITILESYQTYTVPDDTVYLGYQIINNGTEILPDAFLIDDIDYLVGVREELLKEKLKNGTEWVAFGDSITSGYYSYFNDDGSASSKSSGVAYNWSTLLADINHWNITNMGYGGMGWLYSSTSASTYLAYNRVQEIDFSEYNLVTFAYGINDWKSGAVSFGELTDEASDSPTTVVSSMKYCFDYVMESNPNCKIIVILPLNCRGYSYNYGDESTSWARGYTINGLTLDEFSEKMKEVCDFYGIEYIDMTKHSCINIGNIATMLPDGVHPSIDCHALLAREIAAKINFK